ncbi:DUF4326 domain-containing protein [Jiella marina]|uniref:DUF4326 domain-containing protein n=1 Tax=Jiella sp. LLJ827 TaxID=2917712 RepID=UPI0021009C61|nr:DUF4326 domain-containing protein [Jiella sp. LLJ827]MCQ0986439.1 DUF4326 domain-containing protein [Jiella sp. LLJ827]
MTRPARLRLSRARGFDLQALSRETNGLPAIVVARPTKWGNPFTVPRNGSAAECVDLYAKLIGASLIACVAQPTTEEQEDAIVAFRADWRELAGHNLACWCQAGQPCHADVLLDAVAEMETRG